LVLNSVVPGNSSLEKFHSINLQEYFKEINHMSTKNVLRLFVVLSLLVGLFGVAAPAFAAASDIVVSYTLPAAQINAGTTFSVPVAIAVTGTQKLTGLQFNMSWDPTKLDLVSVTAGNFFALCTAATTPFTNAPTINHAAGTMVNYGIAGLGIPATQGCYNTGAGANSTGTVLVTLNFSAIANGQSAQAISGVIFSDVNSTAYSAANYTFPGFSLFVGAAPKLVVQTVGFTIGAGNNFTAVVTVANTGGSASSADTMVVAAGAATPASTNVPVPAIAAGASQQFSIPLVLTAANSLVTASIATFATTANNTYALAADGGQTPVDASFGAFIKFTAPAAVSFTGMKLGANYQYGSLNVKCNANYQVDVTSDKVFFSTPWNGTAYVAGSAMANPLHLVTGASGGNHDVTNGTPAALVTGAGVAGQVGDLGQTHNVDFYQFLSYADAVLPIGQTYHQVLTFNAYVTL
jgi:hypothetical protein